MAVGWSSPSSIAAVPDSSVKPPRVDAKDGDDGPNTQSSIFQLSEDERVPEEYAVESLSKVVLRRLKVTSFANFSIRTHCERSWSSPTFSHARVIEVSLTRYTTPCRTASLPASPLEGFTTTTSLAWNLWAGRALDALSSLFESSTMEWPSRPPSTFVI